MSDERRCSWCRHYEVEYRTAVAMGEVWQGQLRSCALNRPLQPCADYEREVGADDERGEHE